MEKFKTNIDDFLELYDSYFDDDSKKYSRLFLAFEGIKTNRSAKAHVWFTSVIGQCAVYDHNFLYLFNLSQEQSQYIATHSLTLKFSKILGSQNAVNSFIEEIKKLGLFFKFDFRVNSYLMHKKNHTNHFKSPHLQIAQELDMPIVRQFIFSFYKEINNPLLKAYDFAVLDYHLSINRYYVYKIDNKIIGIGALDIISFKIPYIYHLYILPEYRMRGIAKEIILSLMTILILEDNKIIMIEADADNFVTNKMFVDVGFKYFGGYTSYTFENAIYFSYKIFFRVIKQLFINIFSFNKGF